MKSLKSTIFLGLIGFGLNGSTIAHSRVNYFNALSHALCAAAVACAAYASYSFVKQHNAECEQIEACQKTDKELRELKRAIGTLNEAHMNKNDIQAQAFNPHIKYSTPAEIAAVGGAFSALKAKNAEYAKSRSFDSLSQEWDSVLAGNGLKADTSSDYFMHKNEVQKVINAGRIISVYEGITKAIDDNQKDGNRLKSSKKTTVFSAASYALMAAVLAYQYYRFVWRSPIFGK